MGLDMPGRAGATQGRTRIPEGPMPLPRWCDSSSSTTSGRETKMVIRPHRKPALQLVFGPGGKLAVRVCASSLDPALLPFALRAIFAGQGGAAGKGSEFPRKVLYLGRNHEELARRSFRHLGEGLQVEVAERLGREVSAFESLEELACHLDLGRLDVAVGLGLAF